MNPFAGNSFSTFGTNTINALSLGGINYTRMFSPTLINEARVGFSRTVQDVYGNTVGTDYASQFGITGGTTDPKLVGLPHIAIRNLLALGPSPATPVITAVTNYEFGDTLTWVKSKHMVKFGADIIHSLFFQPYYNNMRGTFNFLGRWTNVPYADFLLGDLNTASRQIGSANDYLFSTNYGFFAQDDYKVTPSLTLNLGVRYDLMKPPVDKYNHWTNFLPQYGQVMLVNNQVVPNLAGLISQAGLEGRIGYASDHGLPNALIYPNTHNFAPRVGLAWRPFGGTRTVVRSGYGIFYASNAQNDMRNSLGNTFPFAISQTFQRNAKNPSALTLAKPFPANLGSMNGVNNVAGYELRAAAPYLQSWNLTIEHELFPSVALETAYVGSKGTHLPNQINYNQPYETPGMPTPLQQFNQIDYFWFATNSSYNAGMVTLRKRFSQGTFFRFNYTFSKSIDEGSQMAGAGDGGMNKPQDSRNLRLERGRSDWDITHVLTLSFVSEVPFFGHNRFLGGWQFAGSGRVYSGQPFTPQVANAQVGLGEAIRPNRIAAGTAANPSVERWFDLSAFSAVPLGSYVFGNSGRNILNGPGYAQVNLSLMKNFRLRERDKVQFRFEVFNIMNHPNFNLPVVDVDVVNAGTITTADPGRTVQVALKYIF